MTAVNIDHAKFPEDIRHEAEAAVRAVTYGDNEPPEIDAASPTEEFIHDVVDRLERHGLLAAPGSAVIEVTADQVEAAALAGAQARRGVTTQVNDTDRAVARAVLETALGGPR